MAISSVLNQEHISFRAGDISILTSMKGGSNLSNRQTDIQEISNDFDLLYKHSINASKKKKDISPIIGDIPVLVLIQ